jgi:hypothetical protein
LDQTATVAVEEEIAVSHEVMAEPAPLHWTPLGRVGFRMAFLFFFCFIFLYGNGTIFSIFPVAGDWINGILTWPTNKLAEWVGVHVFHLTGIAARWHPTGSGDTTLNWIENGLFVLYALAGGLLWTAIATARGNRRTEYQTLYAWLRFGLRLTCGMFMLNYGLAKVYPLQMPPMSIAVLNEPVGNSSPMTLLWSLIGMNPVYEMVCGFAEVLGGVLFLFRRTALMGALLSAFVMTNVVLYNFFFDVPVKLFALVLLLASLFVALPDVPALFSFFWKHQPAAPSGVWIPPMSRKGFRVATRTVELVFTIGFLVLMPFNDGMTWWQNHKAAQIQSPLLGAWKLDAAHKASGAFITPEGAPATELYVDTVVRAFTRAPDGQLWRTRLRLDAEKHTLAVRFYRASGITYDWQMPDNDHLVLTSKAPDTPKGKKPEPFTPEVMTFTRIPTPAHYPLLDRGFHFVNQWGLER